MTDWNSVAIAKGIPDDDRVTGPLAKLEAQFEAAKSQILLETEPVTFHVLPLPEGK